MALALEEDRELELELEVSESEDDEISSSGENGEPSNLESSPPEPLPSAGSAWILVPGGEIVVTGLGSSFAGGAAPLPAVSPADCACSR